MTRKAPNSCLRAKKPDLTTFVVKALGPSISFKILVAQELFH